MEASGGNGVLLQVQVGKWQMDCAWLNAMADSLLAAVGGCCCAYHLYMYEGAKLCDNR